MKRWIGYGRGGPAPCATASVQLIENIAIENGGVDTVPTCKYFVRNNYGSLAAFGYGDVFVCTGGFFFWPYFDSAGLDI